MKGLKAYKNNKAHNSVIKLFELFEFKIQYKLK